MSSPTARTSSNELSGTLVGGDDVSLVQHALDVSPAQISEQLIPSGGDTAPTEENDRDGIVDQALESHEVIELQIFSEKKAWIQQKIKFLENLPPVEVFVGLDSIRSSAEEIPGLPTRAELKKWLVEHDQIEKDTDVFDSGELQKLRKFTKAATQRNLSPEDTDLIELTLTTIYELDKLLHLLRDQSDNLDLLGMRLTWEEHRIGSWGDRRNIISDLDSFLATRARWSPSVYEVPTPEDTILKRRNSIASMASGTSASADSLTQFSRGARFKLAEQLSRDAAQFGGRVTTLRHGGISAAGKALDKLIDHSRTPIPDELLDEQDKLEEKGMNDMENVGKFVMNVVMQWRKADEFYVDTMKDQSTAQNLLEEIETAKLQHPTSRQSASFVSRADTLVKRLLLRGNPTSSATLFPCPIHPLFPAQHASNESLTHFLSSEITSTMALAKKVEAIAMEYRTAYDAVKHVEILSKTASDLSAQYESIVDRLENGMMSKDGDGSPPNLTSEGCLETTHHSAFLALFPSIIQELENANPKSDQLLRSSQTAILNLEHPGIESSFKANVTSEFQRLTVLRAHSQKTRLDVIARIDRLRNVRKVWVAMEGVLNDLEALRQRIGETMEKQRWRKQTVHTRTPLTPESPVATSPYPCISNVEVARCLNSIRTDLSRNIDAPLSSMLPSLESPLHEWLSQRVVNLNCLLESVRHMAQLLESIQGQFAVMSIVHDEFNELQIRTEDLKLHLDSAIGDVLAGKLLSDDLSIATSELDKNAENLRLAVQRFIDGLSHRISFVSQQDLSSWAHSAVVKQKLTLERLKLGSFQGRLAIELPFDLTSLDDDVRADSNSFVMRLSGELRNLRQKQDHFHLACMAKDVDSALLCILDDINRSIQGLATFKASISSAVQRGDGVEPLQSLATHFEGFSLERRSSIARTFSPVRDLLRRMDSAPGSHDAAVHEVMLLARSRAVDDAELKFNVWLDDAMSVKTQIMEAQNMAQMAKELDITLSSTVENIQQVTNELHSFRTSLSMVLGNGNDTEHLQSLSCDLEDFSRERLPQISDSFTPIHDLLRRMESAPSSHDGIAREVTLIPRTRAVGDAKLKFNLWKESIVLFRQEVDEVQKCAQIGKELDSALSDIVNEINSISEELTSFRGDLVSIVEHGNAAHPLQSLTERLDELSQGRANRIAGSFPSIRNLLLSMDSSSCSQDATVRSAIFMPRSRAVDDVEVRFNAWKSDLAFLKGCVLEAQRIEEQRLEDERITEERRIQAEEERRALEEYKKARLERERIESERAKVEEERIAKMQLEQQEQARSEHDRTEAVAGEERSAKQLRLREQECHTAEFSEKARLEQVQPEEKLLRADETELRQPHDEQLGFEEVERAMLEPEGWKEDLTEKGVFIQHNQAVAKEVHTKLPFPGEDVFGLRLAPSSSRTAMTSDMSDLQTLILSLRKRLRSISINDVARPSLSSPTSNQLPSQERRKRMEELFSALSDHVSRLPSSVDDQSVDIELRSLRAEMEASAILLDRVRKLADFSDVVRLCEAALSDLLEHIDSYPAVPKGLLSSSHVSLGNSPPEEQLKARLSFTKSIIDSMTAQFNGIADDRRTAAERQQILETWSELEDMASDRMSGRRSRPASAFSSGPASGRSSSASVPITQPGSTKKKGHGYSSLSVSSSDGRMLPPSHNKSRRAVSGATDTQSRTSSRMSVVTSNRSVTGPFRATSSKLYGSTFASRQRTTSLSSNARPIHTLTEKKADTPSRPRAETGKTKERASPTFSETSSQTRPLSTRPLSPSRLSNTTSSSSTWARAPRESFPTVKMTPPRRKPSVQLKKAYVANPKNKLDMAVGDVVNKLPVNINIEVVAETWKDQSGKYWIGDQDPKLCFCRILRSKTVMVRVGGGWMELSKFIKTHYADIFRLLPESPTRQAHKEEKWISSATLLEAPENDENVEAVPEPPGTPEPILPFVPSFSISTPSGQSPKSLKTTPSTGSPLTPLQFMRRADADAPILLPVTPSKPPSNINQRARTTPNTPAHPPLVQPHALLTPSHHVAARTSVWRP